MGMGDIPLLCARGPVVGSMTSVVRILLHFLRAGLREVTHVYLDGAERLRDDIDGTS
jgi:chorismate mutase